MQTRKIVLWLLGAVISACSSQFLLIILILVILSTALGGSFEHTDAKSNGTSGSQEPATAGQVMIDQDAKHAWTGARNSVVVSAALALTPYLYACGSEQHDQCFTAQFPKEVAQAMLAACGGCSYAQSGNLQCVMFVVGVFASAGQALPSGPDAKYFWPTYQSLPGWEEIQPNDAPLPGDIAVWSGPTDADNGHVAVVVDEQLPKDGLSGYVQIAEANGIGALNTLTLTEDLTGYTLSFWPHMELLGYIRHTAFVV